MGRINFLEAIGNIQLNETPHGVTHVTKLPKGGHSRFRRESVEVKQRIHK